MNKLIYFLAFFSIACAIIVKTSNTVETQTGAVKYGNDVVYQYGPVLANMGLVVKRGEGFTIYDLSTTEMFVVNSSSENCLQIVINGPEMDISTPCIKHLPDHD